MKINEHIKYWINSSDDDFQISNPLAYEILKTGIEIV